MKKFLKLTIFILLIYSNFILASQHIFELEFEIVLDGFRLQIPHDYKYKVYCISPDRIGLAIISPDHIETTFYVYSYENKKFIYKQKYNGKIKKINNYVLFYNTIYNTLTNNSCRFDYNEKIIHLDPIEEFVVTKKKLQNREFDRVYWKKAGYFEFNRMQ